jgi:inner membrane protein
MLGRTHLLLSAAGYAALASRPLPTPLGGLGAPLPGGVGLESVPVALAAGTLLAAIAGLGPDLDRSGSSAARSLGLPSRVVGWIVQHSLGHRGPLHSAAAVLLVFVAGEAAGASAGVDHLGAVLAFGWASHLLLDALTARGVPLLWPLPTRLRLPPGFATGGLVERLVLALALLACAVWATGSPWATELGATLQR